MPGPMKRAELNTMLLIATAVARSWRGTRFGTRASRAGWLNPITTPPNSTRARSSGTVIRPLAVSPNRARDCSHQQQLRDLDHPQAIDAVGERAAERADHHGREQIGERDQTQHRARVAELPGQPADADPLHPGADQRDAVAGDVDAEVRLRERARDRAKAPQERHRGRAARRPRLLMASFIRETPPVDQDRANRDATQSGRWSGSRATSSARYAARRRGWTEEIGRPPGRRQSIG